MEKWGTRACAIAPDSDKFLRDVVRDLLANPQVRIVLFDGPICGMQGYLDFWQGARRPQWRIDEEHLQLVRQFVDVYYDDCSLKVQAQPFWPARIVYTDEMEAT